MMQPLTEYIIPVSGLKIGIHRFDFQVDRSFFQHFEGSPIEEGVFQVHLDFDKRYDLYELKFDISGHVKVACDRCLEHIQLPVKGNHMLIVKLTEENLDEDADIVFIAPDVTSVDVSKWVYEYICLSLPLRNVYDCEKDPNRVCNDEILGFLAKSSEQHTDKKEEAPDADKQNDIWTQLNKQWNKN